MRAYWFLDKKTNEAKVFGSITAMASYIGSIEGRKYLLGKESVQGSLNQQFSRNKLTEYEDERFRIVKGEVVHSKRVVL